MESIEVSAKTIEDAVLEAAIQLGTTRDKVAYEVITQPTSGFLGIGGRKAVIRAHQKSDEEIEAKEKADKEMEKLLNRVNEKKEAPKPSEPVKKTEAPKKQEKPVEAKKQAAPKSEAPKAALASAVKEAPKAAVPASAPKSDKPAVPVDTAPVEKFLKDVFGAMGMEVTVNITQNPQDREMNITLDGADMGVLIGKRGQTLDSLQYLSSLVVNKNTEDYIRVKVDTENYRERRKATLENLAKNIAQKVKRTRKPVSLEPMNPYERRVIHSALQNDKYVCTHSEGEDPYRRVVVTLKEGVKLDNYGNRNRGRYNRNYNKKKER
ncbi:RNA-binding cell elongation regulator Jag/EloR [Laedolimicola ammoniilytica]|uniref:RNA-binding protein KhpB n=1 Tax=Laedolimicola ammoniilytica TaxID=2981771 RepID=A0ABT2RSM9_9FIRM|nr:RNA-binding cell elongation regulator Jag/EloR [Laedolimicola ammoniilytica]MCU6695321.1 KH domain-containing protein [Laedolimicola ammoniilytica]SCG91765.1 Predicted RNA-binding protein (contains KH domain) [uncultured Clostridium sp.]